MEQEEIAKLITKWNPHFVDQGLGKWVGTIPRLHYLDRILSSMSLRHVIVLTGVRRSGKSILMQQLIGKLWEEGVPLNNLLYIHLEDVLLTPHLHLGHALLEQIYTYYLQKYNPKGKVYVFLDEIQGVKDFNKWIYSRYESDENIKFIISGSRQSLIESQASTLLTGRTVRFDIFPFNFYEYLNINHVEVKLGSSVEEIQDKNYTKINEIIHFMDKYLYEGGYPEIVLEKVSYNKELIANSYYRDIITRDIINPNRARNIGEIESLGLSVLSDFAKAHTYRSLGKPQKLSPETVRTYLNYFYKSYLFFECTFFSFKTKETQDVQRPRKLYVVDNGIRNFNVAVLREDFGPCAENLVFLELMKNYPSVHYWKGKQEVDFVVSNPVGEEKLMLINVTYSSDIPDREEKGMLEGMDEFGLSRGIILTKDYYAKKEVGKKTIEYIPLWSWLILNTNTHSRTYPFLL